jgi:RimJ/RimL family protein N-acetyltransferase
VRTAAENESTWFSLLRSDETVTDPHPTPLPARTDLTDGVVLLRQPLEDDVPAITSGASEPSVALYTTVPSPYQESDARWFVDEVRATWQAGTAAAVGNTPSRNVVEHCGYRFEGTCRLGMKQRGQRIDAWVGGLIATELIR